MIEKMSIAKKVFSLTVIFSLLLLNSVANANEIYAGTEKGRGGRPDCDYYVISETVREAADPQNLKLGFHDIYVQTNTYVNGKFDRRSQWRFYNSRKVWYLTLDGVGDEYDWTVEKFGYPITEVLRQSYKVIYGEIPSWLFP